MERDITSREGALDVLKTLFLAIISNEKMDKLVKQNKGAGFFISTAGHDIVGAAVSKALFERDWAFPYYRDRAFAIGRGCPLYEIFAAFLARDIPHHSGGRMMLDHFSDKERLIPCQSSCVGAQFLQAAGVAKGISLEGKDSIVYVSSGDGATSQGDFHEALNFSSIHKLPLFIVVQDNGYAISTKSFEQTAGGDICKMASGYENLKVMSARGADYEDLSSAVLESISYIREGRGPALLVAKVPRLGPHTISDDPTRYKKREEIEREKREDPSLHFERWVIDKGYISKEEVDRLREDCRKEVERAALKAEGIPFPKRSSASSGVFAPFSVDKKEPKLSSEKVTMIEAVNHAISEEMERDGKVLVFGEDVAREKGGVFGATKGLTEKFGERCFNTPLAESTIIGVAVGLAFYGMRPICEIQFSDYCWSGINQLVNELASIYYRSNGEWASPVVVRMTCGGYVQGGPYHSQSLEGIFSHIPGLKIAVPSNALDAKRLLKCAVRDPNPVIFLEHKALYRDEKSRSFESSSDVLLPFGIARIVKEGDDITAVCWGKMVEFTKEVSDEVDISIEIIDLRTINPLDIDTVLKSLEKTGKLLIVHEGCRRSGFGAEIAFEVIERGFEYLDAPIKRVAAADCPVPYCKDLEDEVLPQKDDIKEAIIELYSF